MTAFIVAAAALAVAPLLLARLVAASARAMFTANWGK
jgi:hypothetical protein